MWFFSETSTKSDRNSTTEKSGKFGQGLASRYTNTEIFGQEEIDEGKKMPRCAVTLPHAAATIPGLIRAVLNVLVLEASKIGTVLSATTDGIMVHVPDMSLPGQIDKGKPHLDPPKALLEACEKHPSVQLLQQGRKHIGENPDTWLEVKYAGNEAYTVKTRMNWIGWNGKTVHQAMVGLKKEDIGFHELMEIRDQRLHRYYTDHSLHKINDVIEGKARDITSHYTSKEVNLAPDWKRKFSVDGTSVPFRSIEEWREYRKVVDKLHWEAFPERVEMVRSGKRVKRGKGQTSPTLTAIQRSVLHRIALGHAGFRLPKGLSERDVCSTMGVAINTLSKLKRERQVWAPIPVDHPETHRIQTLLHLW